VSILVKKRYKGYITTWEALNENMIKINMNLFGKKLCILGIYAISDDENALVKEEFWGKLNEVITEIGTSREILIAGDFNSRTGKKTKNLVVGPFGEEVTNDNGDKLIDICEQNSLTILNGYFKHKRIHQYTWHQDTKDLRSIIDYIITRQNTSLKFQDVRVFRGMTVGSDHYLVNAKSLFLYGRNNVNESRENITDGTLELPQLPVYNIDSLRDESTSFLYKKRLDEKLGESHFESTEECYQHVVKCIHQAAKEALGEKILRSKTKPFYYWNEEIGQLVKEKKGKYMKWISSKDPQDRIELRRIQGKIRKMVTEAKNKSWEKTCSTVESYLGGKRSTEAWRILKNLRKTENGGQWFNPIPIDKWETYFKELLTENRERYMGEQETESEDVNETGRDKIELDINIVKMTIRSLKSNTSCGVGGVPAELLKAGTEKLYELLRQIFERCINGEGVPQDWKMGYISAIYKKGKKDEYENYRGITVLNIFSRLYGKMIKYFLDQEFLQMETEEQAGFRAGRSTIDHIFCLKQLIEKKMAVDEPLHLLFVDLEKAYESVPLQNLWKALERYNLVVILLGQ